MAKKVKAQNGGLDAAQTAGVATLHGTPLTVGDVAKAQKGKPGVGIQSELAVKNISIVKGFNPRALVGDIEVLADSIKKDGLISPVCVRPEEGKPSKFLLVCGERRLRAVQLLGWESIPCVIRQDLEGDDLKAKAVAVAENSDDARYNLNSIEIGRVVKELVEAGWTISRIAQETGFHSQKIRRCQTLMEAPKDVQLKVEAGEMSMVAGLELARLDPHIRKKIQDSLHPSISAAEIKKLGKVAAKSEKEVVTGSEKDKGKSAKYLKGKQRDAALVVWRPSKEKQGRLQEVAHVIHSATKEDEGYSQYHELRGIAATLLWDRNELATPYPPTTMPESEDNVAAAKAELKKYNELIEIEAKKYKVAEPKHKGQKIKS